MPRPYAIHWDQVLRYLPPSVPMPYRVEADGLPAVDSLVQAGTGAEGKAIRQFQAHLLHAMIHRIHDLEGSLASCEADKGAMDKALSSTPAAQGTPAIDNGNPAIPLFRDVAQELLQYFDYKIDGKSDLDVAAMFQSKASTIFQALGLFMDPSSREDSPETQKRLEQLEADLKRANTKANVYYTSWKSLERHVNHKARVVPSDEMNLAAAVTALVERGYIRDIQPNGNIPVETMCQMVAGIAEKLPPTEAISFNVGDHVLEPVLEVGDPYPTEFRLHANANGVVHSYFRADKATPAYSVDVEIRDEKNGETCAVVQTNLPGLRAADVTGYEELEQINARLETQLRAAQKELAEAACWMDTAQQHAKNEEFYRDLLDQVAVALQNPDVYKSDDGSIQQDPIRLKIPELVAKLHAMGCENINLLAHQTVLLDKFRSGVRAITNPGEGQDEKLLEMLHRMKSRAPYTGNGTHLQADAQPEEPKAQAVPNVIDMAFQGLLDRITNPTQPEPLEDCHTVAAEPLQLSLGFPDGNVLERRFNGFDFTVLTIPQAITPKQELGNHMMGCEYMVETNTLYLLAAWRGEHPANWKLDAKFDLRPQIIHREL